MNYCENCHLATPAEKCPRCGKRRLRPVEEGDMCALTDCSSEWYALNAYLFEDAGIFVVTMPVGSGVRSRVALPLEGCRLFVPWEKFLAAADIIRRVDADAESRLQSALHEKLSLLHISERAEKRARKKLHLPKECDIIEYLKKILRSECTVRDGGRISSSTKNGRYLFCEGEGICVCIDSATMEVLSVVPE